jgi:putative transposase
LGQRSSHCVYHREPGKACIGSCCQVKTNQAFRYELDPNNVQHGALVQHAGVARFAYNWALADRIERFEQNEGKAKFTSAIEQHKLLNSLKVAQFSWMYSVSKCAPQEALRDCERAYRNFWRGRKQGQDIGFPTFKKKGQHDSFRLTGSLHVKEHGVVLPRIGRIRTKEGTEKFRGRILSATVSREADRWFCSLAVEVERAKPLAVVGEAVGIDLGIKTFAVLSNGERFESPKLLKRKMKKFQLLSRQVSRKKKGSKNRTKANLHVARLNRSIRNIRKDFLHKLSTSVAKSHGIVCIEDLAERNMVRNHHLAQSISDAGWGEFRRMLAYKCSWYGSELRVIGRFAASSKTCSVCGEVNYSLALADRTWVCENCGTLHDRDDNASVNILNLGMGSHRPEPHPSKIGCNACGGPLTKRRSQKQEASSPVFLHEVVCNE